MDFTPPDLGTLKANASNLDARFSTLIGRYQICPLAAESGVIGQRKTNSLEILIARTSLVTSCETDRTGQKEVFSQLVNELRAFISDSNEANCKQATLFLLGALLHRYFRLIQSYDSSNSILTVPYFGLRFFKFELRNCRFFMAIREALNLPKEMNSNFRVTDLEQLDVTTVVGALECFQRNMMLEDRYKKYPHFAEDPNFLFNLQTLINFHKKRGADVLNQFKAITFLQSLAKKMEEEQSQLETELDKWLKVLKKDHPIAKNLNLATIELHIEEHIKEHKEKILDLLHTPLVKEEFTEFGHEQFINKMKRCQSNIASYTILGGCVLILESSLASDDLKHSVLQVLGIEGRIETLSCTARRDSIKLLSYYLEDNPETEFDTLFFGNFAAFKTELARLSKSIIERGQEQSVDTRVFI